MTIKIKTLTVRNFLSVGNATQALNFDRKDLTLVLGENLDLGGDDSGARNGVGKTTIINALSYSLYGQALTNIRKDNLINKSNGKNMLVTIEFEVGGINYRIERGRRPGVMRYFVGDAEQKVAEDEGENNAQGDSRETQQELERIIGLSHEMFKHVVALNTYTEPFLALRANDQRIIIEQLLGITLLSERADKLKEQIRVTKEDISKEEFRIKAVLDANKRIEAQIVSLQQRQKLWANKQIDDCASLKESINNLEHINIESEIQAHRELVDYLSLKALHEELSTLHSSLKIEIGNQEKNITALKKDFNLLNKHKCYVCGHELHDTQQEKLKTEKEKKLADAVESLATLQAKEAELSSQRELLAELPKIPKTYYKSLEEALRHQHTVESLKKDLDNRANEVDPYAEQILEMSRAALEEVTYDQVNTLNSLKEHQEFLLKLLTNKDSFVRKRIIDQNLTFLNSRLGLYLEQMGLPHVVSFQNDLSVNITELGRELDFDNLSRGERCRLILSLSWAFRDVWENLYVPINLLFIDELIDNGLDTSGVESAIATLKKMSRDSNKSIWLVSHKDELAGRVNNVLNVVKENGFTSFANDVVER
jgi:DNA repair exonuclease SbcCD ATPase subunit